MKLKKIMNAVISVAICLLAGFLGSIATMPSIGSWYALLNKPPLNPPNWIFSPVWTTLFIMMGIAAFLIWDKGLKKKGVKTALYIFAAQLALNTLWSVLFFGMHAPLYAVIEIVFLWAAILASIIAFYRISKVASYLLIPYILWVSFASYLNLMIWLLNK